MNAYRQRASAVSRPETHSLMRDASESYLGAMGTVLVGGSITALPVVFHLVSQPIAIVLCVLLSVILTWIRSTSVPVALIVAYLRDCGLLGRNM